ncbi:thiol:disulfide interchange protein DsbD [Sulfuritortus calidifontis]|uniref:Thiol:disulfide interchange protein DsbD n=1 Tax=Sulfuritortus calidifontis TaxID=1914471 RepID=A0A4R3JZM8_9PROT|nr:protein-disulfide reductase DsbD [Sulfuritortus calidifontis]TCS73320.1 thiol:disulfide interchange protein DsbD [Sulfuritortus calidifontis]
MRHILTAALLLLAALPLRAEEDLLEPEQAFRVSARLVDNANVELQFQVAKGYALYKEKFKFSADSGAKLGAPSMPKGQIKDDEYFGRVETLRDSFKVRIPVSYAGAPKPFKLIAGYQGCADAGVCYPPQETTFTLQPVVAAAAPATGFQPLNSLKQLAGELAGGEPELLPADQAFKLSLTPAGNNAVTARFDLAKSYYLYRDKIKFSVVSPAGAKVAGIDLPQAEEKTDPNFGKMFVYHDGFSATVRLEGLSANGGPVKLKASYQGCSEKGVCYPPIDKSFDLVLGSAAAATSTAPAAPAKAAAVEPEDTSESGQIAAMLKGGSFWVVVASFFGFGLLLALTPCVFPMIPILSGIIVGQGHDITKRHGFMLSLAYVLGMAITYALAGVAAGMSGTLISNALQNPWALGTGAAIFVALALSMFGFYDLQLPSFLQSRFTEASNKMQGGKFTGVFAMGAISALIVGPCVAAPLAGALLYIGQTGDMLLGGVSLFFMALGMGVPLLLVGLSAGALLPRAGAWMEAVKSFFGTLMLAIAIWLVSPLLPPVVVMLLWAALLIVAAMYLRAIDPLEAGASGWRRLWKGVGMIALIAGISLLLGALGGSRDLLQPLQIFKGGAAGSAIAGEPAKLQFRTVKSSAELDAAIAQAKGKYVMLDFYADWCISCKEMERFTFSDAKVQARLKDVVLLKADVTGNTAEDKALLKRFNLFGPPGLIFFDKEGKQSGFRVIGYEPPEKFLQSLDKGMP